MQSRTRKTIHPARHASARKVLLRTAALLGGPASLIAAHADIVVTYDGPASATTCTLAQAIRAANAANGVDASVIGSSTIAGNCTNAVSGPNTITLDHLPLVTLSAIDNYWYGPNALPPIASEIAIAAAGNVTTIRAAHVGDPTPSTANAFRLFYVSGGMELPLGTLTIANAVLQGGYAKGGDSGNGGGGAGMGGAIFNQGTLTLSAVALLDNTAQGGSIVASGHGGGGLGQDGGFLDGGGFGGSIGSGYGGLGSAGSPPVAGGSGGGGGGFLNGSDGGIAAANGGSGGGNGALGGAGTSYLNAGGIAGDGGGGGAGIYAANGGNGAAFGSGGGASSGQGGGGGGGIGGGGASSHYASSGGGGGFGGGGGGLFLSAGGGGHGGFGGGCGFGSFECGGFGGGNDSASVYATGGAGMGGAIFNHAGTVTLRNVTAYRNAARGGAGFLPSGSGSGLGAALFNLNGNFTIDFSTIAGNTLAGDNVHADSFGPADGAVYSLAYGNNIQGGGASTALLTMHSSIVYGTYGAPSDVSVNLVDGANANTSSVVFNGTNFVGHLRTIGTLTLSGSISSADPLLGSLSPYSAAGGNSNPTPVLPFGSNSPAYNAASSCIESDGSTTLTVDIRYAARPYAGQCDAGAYEFDGDYIFADGYQLKL